MPQKLHHSVVINFIESRDRIGFQCPVHLLACDFRFESVQRIVLALRLAEIIGEAEKVLPLGVCRE